MCVSKRLSRCSKGKPKGPAGWKTGSPTNFSAQNSTGTHLICRRLTGGALPQEISLHYSIPLEWTVSTLQIIIYMQKASKHALNLPSIPVTQKVKHFYEQSPESRAVEHCFVASILKKPGNTQRHWVTDSLGLISKQRKKDCPIMLARTGVPCKDVGI